jgi:hypothetical protein
VGSIPAFSDTVESEGRQMKQCRIQYIEKNKNPPVKSRKIVCRGSKYKQATSIESTWPVIYISVSLWGRGMDPTEGKQKEGVMGMKVGGNYSTYNETTV